MIKNVAVHLTGSHEDDVRLANARDIARTFEAHLLGLYVHVLPENLSITDPSGSALLQRLFGDTNVSAEVANETLKAKLGSLDISHELRRLDVLPGDVGRVLASEVRMADLFVGTRPYGGPAGQSRIEEAVLFLSGRGCLFVPPQGIPPSSYATILVAWNNTREAARAISEALPFLQQAHIVVVAMVEEHHASEEQRLEVGADIGRYLSRHGVSAEIRKIGGWIDPGAALLNEAKQIGADMVVMGGYGHSRFREWVLGGVTRQALSESPVPVLTAH